MYRAMKEDENSHPVITPTARTLGVRPEIDVNVADVLVFPETGGMSVAPDDYRNLPEHRLPPSLGGTGKDPVWEFDTALMPAGLRFRQDRTYHGLIEPRWSVTLDEFQFALAGTALDWRKVE